MMKTTNGRAKGQTWLNALAEAAKLQGLELPRFDEWGMGALRSSTTASGRFVTLKRRIGDAAKDESEGVEWALWHQLDDLPVPVAAFRDPLEPDHDSVVAALSLLKGWLVDGWAPDEAKNNVAKHLGAQPVKSPPTRTATTQETGMDDRSLVSGLLAIGAAARQKGPGAYAAPGDDPTLKDIGPATIAVWLEELGRQRLVADVQPCFSKSGPNFIFQITEDAANLFADEVRLAVWLDKFLPSTPAFDVFISYAALDSGIAGELQQDLEAQGLRCFMAEKDIRVAEEWQDSIRAALTGSTYVLVLLTPRSIERPWVLMETGAAWALGKALIPALSHVAANDLIDPIRRHQARVIETTAQRKALVRELSGRATQVSRKHRRKKR